MKKSDKPSEYFMGAILRAYDKAEREGGPVTCSKLWDYMVMECFYAPGGFKTMFSWDTSNAKNKNRIRDISETIGRHMGNMLCLKYDDRGHEIVVKVNRRDKNERRME